MWSLRSRSLTSTQETSPSCNQLPLRPGVVLAARRRLARIDAVADMSSLETLGCWESTTRGTGHEPSSSDRSFCRASPISADPGAPGAVHAPIDHLHGD